MKNLIVSAAVVALATSAASAQILVDGTADAAYGSALAVQNVQTMFGDSNLGLIDRANGSEIDGLFATYQECVLHILIAGNLESNFNNLVVFIDSRAGGQNRLRGDNPDINFNGLNRMGDDGSGNGLMFDDSFTADYCFLVANGTPGGGAWRTFANFAELRADGRGFGAFLGTGGAGEETLDNSEYGVKIGLNNSNTAGVGGGSSAADGTGVRTGVEIAIPLEHLGVEFYRPQAIKICAFVASAGVDFLSNQFIAGLGPRNMNLGEVRSVNLAAIPGDQYVMIAVPPSLPGCPGPSDCNTDGVEDYVQCRDGSLPDYNLNNIPDCCEAGTPCEVGNYPVQWRVEDGGNGHWYQVTAPATRNWQQAQDAASAVGAHLATLTSSAENAWVTNLFRTSAPGQEQAFVGGFQDRTARDYSEPAGGWRWITGEPMTFTAWTSGNPSNVPFAPCGCEDFMTVVSIASSNDVWNDVSDGFGVDPAQGGGVPSIIEWSDDCNGDGIVDYGQILLGQLGDANVNGVPEICECDADINNSGAVNGVDLAIVLGAWGTNGQADGDADIDNDGIVNGVDLALVLAGWGPCP
jgi:hypothetical protein